MKPINGDHRYSGELQRLGFSHATTELGIAASQRGAINNFLALTEK